MMKNLSFQRLKDFQKLLKNAQLDGYICGRTDCGRLVSFKGDKSLIGVFVNVEIQSAKSASLFGKIC